MKKTIKFLTGNPSYYTQHEDPYFYISPLLCMLKTYHDHFGKSKEDYTWLNCKNDILGTLDEYVEEICKEDIDILGISLFTWNKLFYEDFIKKYKKLRPNTLIVMGGPEVTARTDPDWFIKYPEVDYVIYGDGEKAFSNLLDYLVNDDVKIADIPNLIYLNEGKKVINKHEIMRDKNYWALSPVIHCKEYLRQEIDYITKILPNVVPAFIWERSRGCPYSCSFCDWSGGLHNKVSKRSCSFKDEIDVMTSFNNGDIAYYIADANFGMFDEDFEIIKYIDENVIKKHPKFLMIVPNWSKNNKDRVFKIWDYIIEKDSKITVGKSLKISIQDIHDEVLTNINRPSIPWKDVKSYYMSKRNKFDLMAELIAGMPGQTRKTWNETLFEITDILPHYIISHYFIILPYSPAGDPEYQKKFGIKYTPTFVPKQNMTDLTEANRDELIQSILKTSGVGSKNSGNAPFMFFNMVTETYSFNLEDLIYFHLSANYILQMILQARSIAANNVQLLNSKVITDMTKTKFIKSMPMLEKLAKEQYDIVKADYDKYGVLLFCAKHPKGFYCDYHLWFTDRIHDERIPKNKLIKSNQELCLV